MFRLSSSVTRLGRLAIAKSKTSSPFLGSFFSTAGKARSVLICLDGKEPRDVIDFAEKNILHPDDQVHVMHVYDPIAASALKKIGVSPTQDVLKGFEHVLECKAESIASSLAKELASKGHEAKAVTMKGNPTAAICHYAEENQADLVVVGKRGHGEIGDVAEDVLKNCSRPVFVYTRDEMEAEATNPKQQLRPDKGFKLHKKKSTVRFPL
mmetsp:Transcript_1605/g.3022  ORF Transcript_1605/g.3022 Transcript_1605/m.3022 type:complete len:210 (-) Transcript_1605:1280-1909(-)|eukprot:CAMPEP_0170166668 /NCGR_PEP_ID=MMETSP0040_2-20121228/291_1 /TAXON_ID=641309 /ORGANISM="Lotharella oceanica, Strain CCMP622" /LENGTH=209 /DNA_ID=CAMNT_0010404459 /DNA_START=71 /DNA_END=700 /DNA_ORIENTATION=+